MHAVTRAISNHELVIGCAHLLEQLSRNDQVVGSNPMGGSRNHKGLAIIASPLWFLSLLLPPSYLSYILLRGNVNLPAQSSPGMSLLQILKISNILKSRLIFFFCRGRNASSKLDKTFLSRPCPAYPPTPGQTALAADGHR